MFNVGVHQIVNYTYPYIHPAPNVDIAGPLAINTRFAWFLPNVAAVDDRPPPLPMETFGRDRFRTVRADYHLDRAQMLRTLRLPPVRHYAPAHCDAGASSGCAIMLAGDPAETAFVAEHIRVLGVSVQVLWLGADQLLRAKQRLLSDGGAKRFLLLARYPSEIVRHVGAYGVVSVPTLGGPLSAMQYGLYDATPMIKYANRGPLLHAFRSLHFEGQVDGLLAAAEQRLRSADAAGVVSNANVFDEAACEWLSAPGATVHGELVGGPRDTHNNTVVVGGIFPAGAQYADLQQAAEMAVQEINAEKWLNVTLELRVGNASEGSLLSYIRLAAISNTLGIIGPEVKAIKCK